MQCQTSDDLQGAVEHLEQLRPSACRVAGFDRRAFLRRTALTGVAAGWGQHDPERVRLELERRPAAARERTGNSASVFGSHRATNSCSSTT